MRVLQLRGQLNLAAEALHVDAGCQLGRKDLHHDAPLECALHGHEHAGHASAAEFPFEEELAVEGALESGWEVAHGTLMKNQWSGVDTARYSPLNPGGEAGPGWRTSLPSRTLLPSCC